MPSKFTWTPDKMNERVDAMVRNRVVGCVRFIERECNRMMRSAHSGRRYRIGTTPTRADKAAGRDFRTHQASAPGEAPAIWTGRLRQSISYAIEKRGWANYKAGVGSNVKYAVFLELGTTRMEPRPMWLPALMTMQARIGEIFAEADGKL